MGKLTASLSAEAPPEDLSGPLRALWWLKKGGLETGPDWERAHAICQGSEGVPAFDRVHALAHWIEGDTANSAYWYRCAGVARAGADPAAEWEIQVAQMSA